MRAVGRGIAAEIATESYPRNCLPWRAVAMGSRWPPFRRAAVGSRRRANPKVLPIAQGHLELGLFRHLMHRDEVMPVRARVRNLKQTGARPRRQIGDPFGATDHCVSRQGTAECRWRCQGWISPKEDAR